MATIPTPTLGMFIPLVVGALGLAASAGIVWNNQGRVTVLESELGLRTQYLPAQITAARMDRIESSVIGMPQKLDLVVLHQTTDEVNIGAAARDIAALQAQVSDMQKRLQQHEDHDFQIDQRKER
jgi:hypothetical protein